MYSIGLVMDLSIVFALLILNCHVCMGDEDRISLALPLPYMTPSVHMEPLLNLERPAGVPNRTVDPKAEFDSLNTTYISEKSWPSNSIKLGTVSAVAFDFKGNVVVFHRADRVWDQHTFNQSNYFTGIQREPIQFPTLVAFNRNTGIASYSVGENLFYMPHGLTIDAEGYVYVTDVALHQVFKFRHFESSFHKEWEMGDRFMPKTFCKPTSVAVLPNGDFFVADGYCHSRIVKYSKDRSKLSQWGINSFAGVALPVALPYYFAIPHALTIADDLGLLCVADRENGRVQCFDYNGKFVSEFHSPVIGDRLFSVAYVAKGGGQLFVVNGPSLSSDPKHYSNVSGFVIDMKSNVILSKFSPSRQDFQNPHDIIVSKDGIEVYVANLFPDKVYKLISTDFELYNKSLAPTLTFQVEKTDTMIEPSSHYDSKMFTWGILSLLFVGSALLFTWLFVRRRNIGNSNTKATLEYRQLMTDGPAADE